MGQYQKTGLGVLVGYRRGYVGHSGQKRGQYLNFEKNWCLYAGVRDFF